MNMENEHQAATSKGSDVQLHRDVSLDSNALEESLAIARDAHRASGNTGVIIIIVSS